MIKIDTAAEIQKERRDSLEVLVVPFERPSWPEKFVCASGGLLLNRTGPSYLFLAAFFAPPFFAAFLAAPFFAAFFPPFLVAISSMCSFLQRFLFPGLPQDDVLTSLLWARVNGAQHLAI
jgi:hypothetical protein